MSVTFLYILLRVGVTKERPACETLNLCGTLMEKKDLGDRLRGDALNRRGDNETYSGDWRICVQ